VQPAIVYYEDLNARAFVSFVHKGATYDDEWLSLKADYFEVRTSIKLSLINLGLITDY
jgi:hypothetical protein